MYKLIAIEFDDDKREFHRFEGNFGNAFIRLAMKDENGFYIKIRGKKYYYDVNIVNPRVKIKRKARVRSLDPRYRTLSEHYDIIKSIQDKKDKMLGRSPHETTRQFCDRT